MAAYADARAAANSVLPLATDAPLYDKIRRRTREDGVEAIGSIKDYTLVECFRTHEGKRQLLLGMKKRGFGMGKYNGFGGKLEPGETMPECASRELHEESGCLVPVEKLQARGRMHFHMLNDSGMLDKRTGRIIPTLKVYVYTAELADVASGTVTESDEMLPQWFEWDEVPLESMWPDDRYWLPTLLAGHDVVGDLEFATQQDILRHNVIALPRGAYAEDPAKHEGAVALPANSVAAETAAPTM